MHRSLTLLCIAAVSFAAGARDAEILQRARANLGKYPQYLQDNLTIANLRQFHSVASISVTSPEGKKEIVNPSRHEQAKVDPAQIVQIGKTIWAIIQDNQPSVNATEDWAGAIPDGMNGQWTKLQDWKSYVSKPFKFEFKNFLGMKLTDYEWTFKFDFNGNINGTGLYVTNLGAATTQVYAYLSEHVDVSCKALTPINTGTTQSPVASMDYIITMISHGEFEKTQVGCHVTVTGAGNFTVVTCDQN